jgi:probable HAF family extracellular repeat protein
VGTATAILAGAAMTSLSASAAPAVKAPSYTFVDLGVWPGDSDSTAFAVNDRQVVVGQSSNESRQRSHAVSWNRGHISDLGTLGAPFDKGAVATDVNDEDEVVGASFDSDDRSHAFMWSDGTMRDLGTLGGSQSYAQAINDRGVVTGWSFTAAGIVRGFIWDGTMHEIPVEGADIDARGQVVGLVTTAPTAHAGVWWKGTVVDLAGFDQRDPTTAHAINDAGVVGGSDDDAHPDSATLWIHGSVTSVRVDGPCPGFPGTTVQDLNDPGDFVGNAPDPGHDGYLGPVVCDAGVQSFLPAGPPPSDSFGYRMNNRADVVGVTNELDAAGFLITNHATLWARS